MKKISNLVLMLGLSTFLSCNPILKKFEKKNFVFPIYAVVDKTTKDKNIEKLIYLSNLELSKLDTLDKKIRLIYKGVLDTLQTKEIINAPEMLEFLRKKYNKNEVLFLTENELIRYDSENFLGFLFIEEKYLYGIAECPGSRMIVKNQSDPVETSYSIVHEFLHNLNVPHNNLSPDDIMKSKRTERIKSSGRISNKTKKIVWESLK